MNIEFNFDKNYKPPKCKHCGKTRGHHRAVSFECPKGTPGRGRTINMWGPEVFEEKPPKPTRAATTAGKALP